MNALKLSNVTKKYDGFILENINIELPQGCIMGFVGENGAGKSTTIKLILDLINRDSGSIEVLGMDNQKAGKEIRENIGVVLDESCFHENLTYVQISKVMKNIYKSWDENEFQEYIKRFSLDPKKTVKEYSRGMKMKLSIAVALAHHPKLLILDEATSGLDPVARDEILDVFYDFIQDEQHSIFISSHITSDLEKICDYITFIHNGQIVLSTTRDELSENFGILKCSEEELEKVDKSIITGIKRNKFGVEALVKKNGISDSFIVDKASIEDIMLFFVKGDKK